MNNEVCLYNQLSLYIWICIGLYMNMYDAQARNIAVVNV